MNNIIAWIAAIAGFMLCCGFAFVSDGCNLKNRRKYKEAIKAHPNFRKEKK